MKTVITAIVLTLCGLCAVSCTKSATDADAAATITSDADLPSDATPTGDVSALAADVTPA